MNVTISYSLLIGNPINIKWVLKSPSDLSFSLLDYELVLTIFNSRTKISIEPAVVLDDSLTFCLNSADQHAMGPGSLSFQIELIEDSAKVFKLQLLDAFRLSIRQNQVLLGSPSGRVPSSPLTFESNLELVTCYRDSEAIATLTQQVEALQQAISTMRQGVLALDAFHLPDDGECTMEQLAEFGLTLDVLENIDKYSSYLLQSTSGSGTTSVHYTLRHSKKISRSHGRGTTTIYLEFVPVAGGECLYFKIVDYTSVILRRYLNTFEVAVDYNDLDAFADDELHDLSLLDEIGIPTDALLAGAVGRLCILGFYGSAISSTFFLTVSSIYENYSTMEFTSFNSSDSYGSYTFVMNPQNNTFTLGFNDNF